MERKRTGGQRKIERLKKRNRRLRLMGALIILAFAGLLANIGYINITYGAEFERRAVRQLIIRQSNVERILEPASGGILDRNRQPLIDNEKVYNVILDVTVLHSLESTRRNPTPQQDILERVHEVLGIPMDRLWRYLETDAYGNLLNPTNWRIIDRQVPAYTALQLSDVRHVHLQEIALRWYPDPLLAPQVLGFIRGDSSWGLEHQYRAELRGDPGRIFRVFHSASDVTTETHPPRDGHWLVSTLDSDIQRIAQRVVDDAARRYNAEYIGISVMNPQTGEVLAMAQWPSFSLENPADGSLFTNPAIAGNWENMTQSEQELHWFRTWSNFFLSTSFEPGSTFKPFVVAAALEAGVITPESRFYCEGVRQFHDWPIGCINHQRHGSLSLTDVLVVSCNLAMMDIVSSLGRNNFYNFRSDFGFGERTNIDLPGEESVSSPLVMPTLAQLNPVELATSSFGQGFNVTSIQALNAFAAIINGGYVMRPHVVSQIVDANGNIVNDTSPAVVRNILSQETSDWMREAMQMVVSPYGTGRRAVIDGHNVGGKTGTGEQGRRDDGWVVTSFVGYMPVENPQFIAMAVVYNPENDRLTASVSAAPMIREVFEEIIRYRQIPPAGSDPIGVVAAAGAELMPNFSGMDLRELTPILNDMDFDYQIVGFGSVVEHHLPPEGQPVPRGTPVFLYLDGNIDDLYDLTFVPNVEGLPEEQAVNLLVSAGLIPVVITETPVGRSAPEPGENEANQERWTVFRQFPASGLHIQRGTQIRLRVRPME